MKIKLIKAEPSSSSVHVPKPMGKEHDKSNLERLKDAFSAFINEEELEKTVLEGGGSGGVDSGPNPMDGVYSIGQIVSGMDWELGDGGLSNSDDAKDKALENLSDDPDFYRKKRLMAANLPEQTLKSTGGINLDMGSGQCREPGYMGVDLFKFDHGTMVDDIELGLPWLDDGSCENIRMSNVPEVDPKVLISTIQRLLMPDGEFTYEGPTEITGMPPHIKEMSKEVIDKAELGPWTKQKFKKTATPDAATSNDAAPRIGIAQYESLPADALLAMDATSYYDSDASSSGRGNRLHGYASQGALVDKVKDLGTDNTGAVSKGGPGLGSSEDNTEKIDMPHLPHVSVGTRKALLDNMDHSFESVPMDSITHVGQEKFVPKKLDKMVDDWESVKDKPISLLKVDDEYHVIDGHHRYLAAKKLGEKEIPAKVYVKASVSKSCPIFKADKWKQIVYCVVLSPDEADLQGDIMTADDIEKSAHDYLLNARTVGASHSHEIDAGVVESYISPIDFNADGQFGPQKVAKGAWVIGIKVEDPRQWQKVLSGEYTGVSVGGLGTRIAI